MFQVKKHEWHPFDCMAHHLQNMTLGHILCSNHIYDPGKSNINYMFWNRVTQANGSMPHFLLSCAENVSPLQASAAAFQVKVESLKQ